MLNGIKTMATKGAAFVSKYSPEILMGLGVVGVTTSTVMACKATIKLSEDILPEWDFQKQEIVELMEVDQATQADMTKVYLNNVVKTVKLYLPAIGLGVLSVGALMGSHRILKRRNVALVAAYKVVDEGFKEYRGRVVDQLGSEKDREFRHGVEKIKVKEKVKDEEGKTKSVTKEVEIINSSDLSSYSVIFDELNLNWTDNAEYNMMFLKTQQTYFNDRLNSVGHVFLNEVYDALGFDRTQSGAVVGWVKDAYTEASSDGYIDFGIFNVYSTKGREFVNGYEPSVILDFNVDGIVFDKI